MPNSDIEEHALALTLMHELQGVPCLPDLPSRFDEEIDIGHHNHSDPLRTQNMACGPLTFNPYIHFVSTSFFFGGREMGLDVRIKRN